MTLANQFPRQILNAGANGQQVYDSVMANARSKIVFEVRGEDNLRPLLRYMQVAQRRVKRTCDPKWVARPA